MSTFNPKKSIMNKESLWKRLQKKKKQQSMQNVALGVCWYSERDWSLVKLTAVDPERFEDTYQDWLKMAEEALKEMGTANIAPERVLIHAEEFAQWRLAKNRPNDADARAEFVSEKLRSTSQPNTGRSNLGEH